MTEKINQFLERRFAPYVFIVLAVFFVYAQTLFYDLSYSDDHVLLGYQYDFNKDFKNIGQAFKEDVFQTPMGLGSYYRPILRVTFILDSQFGAQNVVKMAHLTDLVLHSLSVCLLFALLLKMRVRKDWAFASTLLFAVHPLFVQTVALIASRNDTLLAVFVLPAMLKFIDFVETKKTRYLLWYLFFVLLALFTKETAIFLPLVTFVYLILFEKRERLRSSWRKYTLVYLLSGLMVFGWFQARALALGASISGTPFDIWGSIFESFPVIIPYIGKIFLPFDLAAFPILIDLKFIYGLITISGMIIWFLVARSKNYRLILFGLVWFGAFIAMALVKPAGVIAEFSEHRMYLPAMGFVFVLLGLGRIEGINRFFQKIQPNSNYRRDAVWALFITLAIALASMSMYRAQYYKDGLAFWTYAVETSPNRAFNYNNLGAMYYMANKKEVAVEYYKKTLKINPFEPLVNYNLGLIYEDQGDYENAEIFYKKEMEVNQPYATIYDALGRVYQKQGLKDKALEAWQKAKEIDGTYQPPVDL